LPVCGAAAAAAAASRNARLSPQSRLAALSINQALNWARHATQQQQLAVAAEVAAEVRQRITEAGGVVDYVEVRRRRSGAVPACRTPGPLLLGRTAAYDVAARQCCPGIF